MTQLFASLTPYQQTWVALAFSFGLPSALLAVWAWGNQRFGR